MALPLETQLPAPNAVYAAMLLIQTGVHMGKLVTSMQLHLSAARVTLDAEGKDVYQPTGQGAMLHILDLANPDPDLAPAAAKITDMLNRLTALVAQVNSIRKVL